MTDGKKDRESLIRKARCGEISSDAAEAEAKRLRLGPLARKPKVSDFDPMSEPWWTLPMAMAWIVWRRPRAVLPFWDKYRLEFWDWRSLLHRVDSDARTLYHLVQRRPATLEMLFRLERDAQAHPEKHFFNRQMTFHTAKAALWKALQEGELEATGMSLGANQRAPIQDFEWYDLDNLKEKGRDVVRARRPPPRSPTTDRDNVTQILRRRDGVDADSRPTEHEYTDVVVRRSELMVIWPSFGFESKEAPEIEEKGTLKGDPGTKAKFDWEDVELFVFKMLNAKGDFCDAPMDDWKSQNDLIRVVLEYMEKRPWIGEGNGPSPSTLKTRIAPMVAEWRKTSSTAGN